MHKTVISSGNAGGIALALIVFLVGVVLCFTAIGFICGIPICLCALLMGGKRQRVWKCRRCKYVFNRA